MESPWSNLITYFRSLLTINKALDIRVRFVESGICSDRIRAFVSQPLGLQAHCVKYGADSEGETEHSGFIRRVAYGVYWVAKKR